MLDVRDVLKGVWYMVKIKFCCAGYTPTDNVESGLSSDSDGMTKSDRGGCRTHSNVWEVIRWLHL